MMVLIGLNVAKKTTMPPPKQATPRLLGARRVSQELALTGTPGHHGASPQFEDELEEF